jgi:RNA polymerase sigma-70 factor (ECF subfamily)
MLDMEDSKKMEQIYEKYKNEFFMYAMKILRNEDLAYDAVHNAFVAIIEQKNKYFNLSDHDFRYSAITIVKNKSIDIFRKQKTYADMPIEESKQYSDSEEVSVEQQAIRASEYEVMMKCLKQIDEVSQQVLRMKYYHNMSYKEIGERLSMKPKHVETKIARAKEKMRKLIRSEVSDDGE